MEFPFSINNLLKEDISLIDNKLVPPRNYPAGKTVFHSQLCNIIDKMGEASAKAQGLHGPITSATKLQYSDHQLYILKDPHANNESGVVVGLIKTGHKKLFVYDRHGAQHEMEPLCVLDFYVHESRQRMGCGKRIFEHALKDSNMKPQHIAIDRPSHKFLSFLQKHYHLKGTIPQVNNFVIFDGFFRDRPVHKRRLNITKPPLYPYKRPAPDRREQSHSHGLSGNQNSAGAVHDQPQSRTSSASLRGPPSPHDNAALVQLQREGQKPEQKEALKDIPLQRPPSRERLPSSSSIGRTAPSSASSYSRTGSASSSPAPESHNYMVAHQNMYSRHGATPPLTKDQLSVRDNGPIRQFKAADPPLLGRDGPSKDFLQMRNGMVHHREYQDNKGHLKVTKSPEATQILSNNNNRGSKSAYPMPESVSPPSNVPHGSPYSTHSAKHRLKQDSTLNIFGVPSGYQKPGSSQKYQPTRLW